ncbi:hypothetical protein DdX_17445 [Ditylenchus destructor]|uniref:Regulatory protein zeste n=1 Tax=Ditylenchus destructor TaxID=166010 RepID=A0AAD4QZ54_9BILA|nr:hypothetical protein DdX_17445 [Ditylenchus destructor]
MNSTEKKEILIQIKENWAEINADFDNKGMNRNSRENAWKAIYEECKSQQTPRGTKRAKSEFSGTSSKESMELKRSRLLDLEIESRLLDIQLKKRQIYKSDLEIHSMECELQIPHKFLHITPHCETDTNVTIVNDDFNSEEIFQVEV